METIPRRREHSLEESGRCVALTTELCLLLTETGEMTHDVTRVQEQPFGPQLL